MEKIIAKLNLVKTNIIEKFQDDTVGIVEREFDLSVFGKKNEEIKNIAPYSTLDVELDKNIVNTNEASEISGYSKGWLYQLADSNKVMSFKIGTKRYYLLNSLFKYLKETKRNK